ncbi:cobalt ECF transporter T component CbiQ [Tepidibacter mesophilus]|uniref:cobalt ECF transporter T component CbiQ n=1 Tax=Tepidibacter mesophilus TaxID=655607 RepID=UPI000C08AB4D|nr:cobalt ECF transporter T component CbiQ [Tepidibacter mesophilus]
MLIIDKYAYSNALKDYNPMAKFYFAMSFLILSLLNKNIYTFVSIILFMSVIIVFFAKINFKHYIKMILIPLSFLTISIIAILFSVSKDSKDFLHYIQVLNLNIGITSYSLDTSKVLFFRALSCLTCAYFIALTIPINQLILVFKKIKLPNVFIEMVVLIYRFIFIFLEEAQEIYVAQDMRFGYISIKKSYKSLSMLISSLFVRVMLRYKDMTISLDSKLYNGEFYI